MIGCEAFFYVQVKFVFLHYSLQKNINHFLIKEPGFPWFFSIIVAGILVQAFKMLTQKKKAADYAGLSKKMRSGSCSRNLGLRKISRLYVINRYSPTTYFCFSKLKKLNLLILLSIKRSDRYQAFSYK